MKIDSSNEDVLMYDTKISGVIKVNTKSKIHDVLETHFLNKTCVNSILGFSDRNFKIISSRTTYTEDTDLLTTIFEFVEV